MNSVQKVKCIEQFNCKIFKIAQIIKVLKSFMYRKQVTTNS